MPRSATRLAAALASALFLTGSVPSDAQTCQSALDCAADQYCAYPEGAACADAGDVGACVARPEFCTAIYAPVCGCDGQTYGNECAAASAGVNTRYEGACLAEPSPEPTTPPRSPRACPDAPACGLIDGQVRDFETICDAYDAGAALIFPQVGGACASD